MSPDFPASTDKTEPAANATTRPPAERPGEQSVTFDLTREDLIAFNEAHQRRYPWLTWSRTMWGVVIPLVCFLYWLWIIASADAPWGRFRSSWPLVLVLAAIPLVVFGGAARRRRKKVDRIFARGQQRGLFGDQRVTITPDRLINRTSSEEASVPWSDVQNVVEQPEAAYLYVNERSAVMIPRRAFAADADYEAFVESATRYWEAAGDTVEDE